MVRLAYALNEALDLASPSDSAELVAFARKPMVAPRSQITPSY